MALAYQKKPFTPNGYRELQFVLDSFSAVTTSNVEGKDKSVYSTKGVRYYDFLTLEPVRKLIDPLYDAEIVSASVTVRPLPRSANHIVSVVSCFVPLTVAPTTEEEFLAELDSTFCTFGGKDGFSGSHTNIMNFSRCQAHSSLKPIPIFGSPLRFAMRFTSSRFKDCSVTDSTSNLFMLVLKVHIKSSDLSYVVPDSE